MTQNAIERIEEEHARLCVSGTPGSCGMHGEDYLAATERGEKREEKSKEAEDKNTGEEVGKISGGAAGSSPSSTKDKG